MKKIALFLIFVAFQIYAQSNCCSNSGGREKCELRTGRIKCFNGSYSDECRCKIHHDAQNLSPIENAEIVLSGKYWRCKKTFKFDGKKCVKIDIPSNAVFDSYGVYWECLPGYVREKNRCKKIIVPENAYLTNDGKSWNCNFGFGQKRDKCIKIPIPQNAKINEDGKTWTCIEGYKPYRATCVKR
jgi:hypothetical protein